jgi:hemin uptake protein HemP
MADDRQSDETPRTREAESVPVIDVAEWFGDHREVWLDLDGVRYRLRMTRRKKLILQK